MDVERACEDGSWLLRRVNPLVRHQAPENGPVPRYEDLQASSPAKRPEKSTRLRGRAEARSRGAPRPLAARAPVRLLP